MKFHQKLYKTIEFFTVVIFVIMPPLLSHFFYDQTSQVDISFKFSFLQSVLNLALAIFLYFSSKLDTKKISTNPFKILYFSVSSFVLICLNAYIFQKIAMHFNDFFVFGIRQFEKPENIFSQMNLIFGILVAAFFEEVIYRFYLSNTLNYLGFKSFLYEILIILIFAFSHMANGFFSVINAIIPGIILRYLISKTQSIFPSFIVHSAYNLITIYYLFEKSVI